MYSESKLSKEILGNLPAPKGYRILIAVPEVEEKTKGGIIRPDAIKSREETASIVGQVLEMGPDCYSDPDRFPEGPYCREGDWVMFRAYSGTRFKVGGKEFRLINDDVVEATLSNPEGIERV
jgi:co-chaperonin GroES (HSP10)